MSPESRAPAPPAPPGHQSTVPPAKWPPQRISVSPPSSRVSPSHSSIAGSGRMIHSASAAWRSDRAVEAVRPLDHRRVVVRVRDGDRRQPAAALDLLRRRVVEQRDAVPQHEARRRSGPADRAGRSRSRAWCRPRSARSSGRMLVAVVGAQLGERRPALAVLWDVLALVLADRAGRGRSVRGGELDAAGRADEVLHGAAVYGACPRGLAVGAAEVYASGMAAGVQAPGRRETLTLDAIPGAVARGPALGPRRSRPGCSRPSRRTTCGSSSARWSPTRCATARRASGSTSRSRRRRSSCACRSPTTARAWHRARARIAPEDHGGFGLFFVEQLTRRWGVTRENQRTRVWFELDYRAAA